MSIFQRKKKRREETVSISESEMVIRRIYQITLDYSRGFNHQMKDLLQLGCFRFDMEVGILARVEGDRYEIVQCHAPSGLGLHPGKSFPLEETYCGVTLEAGGPVGFERIGDSELHEHPAYRNFKLESYIGLPLVVGGEIYGTLNFSSPQPRPRDFRDVDIDCLQLMGAWASTEILRRRMENEIRQRSARIDPLTELLNKRGLDETIGRVWARCVRNETPLSAVIFDLDGFRDVHAEHGLWAGEEVLSGLASLLRSTVRPTDILGRIGESRFVVLLSDTPLDQAVGIGRRICVTLENNPIPFASGEATLSARLRFCELNKEIDSVERIVENSEDMETMTGAT